MCKKQICVLYCICNLNLIRQKSCKKYTMEEQNYVQMF